jgi:hypothetical protein
MPADQLVGKRVKLGDGTTGVVQGVHGDNLVIVLDGENAIMFVPCANCTVAGLDQVARKVRAEIRRGRRSDVQIAYREDRARRAELSQDLLACVSQRGTSRESRPQGRRTARTTGSRGDPPPESDLALIPLSAYHAELLRALSRRYGSDA